MAELDTSSSKCTFGFKDMYDAHAWHDLFHKVTKQRHIYSAIRLSTGLSHDCVTLKVCHVLILIDLKPVPAPRGRELGAQTPNKAPSPQIELWSTMTWWSFYQISECQAPLNKRKAPIENFLAISGLLRHWDYVRFVWRQSCDSTLFPWRLSKYFLINTC